VHIKPGIPFRLLLLVSAVLLATVSLPAQRRFASARYSVIDVGTLGGTESVATGVNLHGEVAGTSTMADGLSHAFLYRTGRMTDLGTLTGGRSSEASAISDSGIVVGQSGWTWDRTFPQMTHGFVWQNGVMRDTGDLYCICSFNRRSGESRAYGVDSLGRVVGHSLTARASLWQAFLWVPDAGWGIHGLVDINTPDGGFPSIAYGINDRGEIVGEHANRAFMMRDGRREVLGALPGDVGSSARAVNTAGEVAGFSIAADQARRAFIWNGALHELPTLGGDVSSEALAINVYGDVVGRSGNADLSQAQAVLWRDGAAINLNSRVAASGWVLATATGINDVGQIVGTAVRDGVRRAYLLTPQ
jgi:probable HAF family extracellular repeat protein